MCRVILIIVVYIILICAMCNGSLMKSLRLFGEYIWDGVLVPEWLYMGNVWQVLKTWLANILSSKFLQNFLEFLIIWVITGYSLLVYYLTGAQTFGFVENTRLCFVFVYPCCGEQHFALSCVYALIPSLRCQPEPVICDYPLWKQSYCDALPWEPVDAVLRNRLVKVNFRTSYRKKLQKNILSKRCLDAPFWECSFRPMFFVLNISPYLCVLYGWILLLFVTKTFPNPITFYFFLSLLDFCNSYFVSFALL